jgi:hypothetical protein
MERLTINENKNFYFFLKSKNLTKISSEKCLALSDDYLFNSQINKLINIIEDLRRKILIDSDQISDTIKELEYFLPQGQNNDKLKYLLYNTKSYLSIIDCLNFVKKKNQAKLLSLIEKIMRGDKYIAKYLSSNTEFIKKILIMMEKSSNFEVCIKIMEEIFMNCSKLISIKQFYEEIQKNYLHSESNFSTLCRVLAIMIFDHKKMEFKQIFKYKENLRVSPSVKVTAENLTLCLHLPKFLHNLVKAIRYINNKIDQNLNIQLEELRTCLFYIP